MRATEKGQLQVKLLGEHDGPGGTRQYTAWANGHVLGRVRAVPDQHRLRVAVDDAAAISGPAERHALLDAIGHEAAREEMSGVC